MPRQYKRAVRPVIIPIGPSIAYVQLTKDMYSLIDREDIDLVGTMNWCAQTKTHTQNSYAVREEKDENGRSFTLQMHRLLMGGMADHGNLQTLDNRRCNLRLASFSENNRNKAISRSNTSGLKGAFWHKGKKKWAAGIRVKGRSKHLGYFSTREAAHAAYRVAAVAEAGEFARLE